MNIPTDSQPINSIPSSTRSIPHPPTMSSLFDSINIQLVHTMENLTPQSLSQEDSPLNNHPQFSSLLIPTRTMGSNSQPNASTSASVQCPLSLADLQKSHPDFFEQFITSIADFSYVRLMNIILAAIADHDRQQQGLHSGSSHSSPSLLGLPCMASLIPILIFHYIKHNHHYNSKTLINRIDTLWEYRHILNCYRKRTAFRSTFFYNLYPLFLEPVSLYARYPQHVVQSMLMYYKKNHPIIHDMLVSYHPTLASSGSPSPIPLALQQLASSSSSMAASAGLSVTHGASTSHAVPPLYPFDLALTYGKIALRDTVNPLLPSHHYLRNLLSSTTASPLDHHHDTTLSLPPPPPPSPPSPTPLSQSMDDTDATSISPPSLSHSSSSHNLPSSDGESVSDVHSQSLTTHAGIGGDDLSSPPLATTASVPTPTPTPPPPPPPPTTTTATKGGHGKTAINNHNSNSNSNSTTKSSTTADESSTSVSLYPGSVRCLSSIFPYHAMIKWRVYEDLQRHTDHACSLLSTLSSTPSQDTQSSHDQHRAYISLPLSPQPPPSRPVTSIRDLKRRSRVRSQQCRAIQACITPSSPIASSTLDQSSLGSIYEGQLHDVANEHQRKRQKTSMDSSPLSTQPILLLDRFTRPLIIPSPQSETGLPLHTTHHHFQLPLNLSSRIINYELSTSCVSNDNPALHQHPSL